MTSSTSPRVPLSSVNPASRASAADLDSGLSPDLHSAQNHDTLRALPSGAAELGTGI